jgi:hypothetical protein
MTETNETTPANDPATPNASESTPENPSVEGSSPSSDTTAADTNPAQNAEIPKPNKPNIAEGAKKSGESFAQSMGNMLDSLNKMNDHVDEIKDIAYEALKKSKFGQAVSKRLDSIKDAIGDKIGEKWDESDTKAFLDETKKDIGEKVDELKDYIASTPVGEGLAVVGDYMGEKWDNFEKFKIEDWIRDKPAAEQGSTVAPSVAAPQVQAPRAPLESPSNPPRTVDTQDRIVQLAAENAEERKPAEITPDTPSRQSEITPGK